MRHRIICSALSATLCCFGLTSAHAADTSPQPGPAHAIRVALKAQQAVILSSLMRGVIKRLAVADGSRFARGDVLLELDCSVLKAQTERAQAQARREKLLCESNARLAQKNAKSPLEAAVAKAEADAAFAEALAMQRMLEQCRIVAPFDGVIGSLLVRENQFIVDGQPLMDVLDDSRLVLEFIVPSAWLAWFKPGDVFTFVVDETGGIHHAVLEHFGGQVDPVSQTVKAYARLTDPSPQLIPGMSGSARFADTPDAPRP